MNFMGKILFTYPMHLRRSWEVNRFFASQEIHRVLCYPKVHYQTYFGLKSQNLTLILLTRRISQAPNNASKWQMGFNSVFKELSHSYFTGNRKFLYIKLLWGHYLHTLQKHDEISPITGPRCPEGSGKLMFSHFVTMAQDGGKIVSLTQRPFSTPRKCSWYSFLLEAESTSVP